ncbi:MAG: Phosphoenolpyruvate carboxykinase (GTP) [Candidatus Hinthialibacteria bacterium OLB16]|nr:MAG: Phosphoenolpyruvate carboxykinase (GTP) [Candidatus Hinthialibacteria bacterium OLB16]
MVRHQALDLWVEECAHLCKPEKIVWINGSEEERKQLTEEAIATGEVTPLNQERWPGCLYHRTAENDVARTEDLTFICTRLKDDAGPTNNWLSPDEGYRRASQFFEGSMRGRTMYVIPFCMGPVGSPFSKIGVELTDSIYVVLNMRIMTRVGDEVLNHLGAVGDFTKCLHSKAELDINKRLILHFPEDNTIWSVGSGYGGNVLLGKKCLALRLATDMARREGWMAEHMLILGVERPNGHIQYVAAAFPSACGKTNLAMLVPPEGFSAKGYKVWTVGDDIAWMRIDTDRKLWAINPETGFLELPPAPACTPIRMRLPASVKIPSLRMWYWEKITMVWWEGMGVEPPESGWDWRGNPWKPGMVDENGKPVLGAHPNSRFTAPFSQCPSRSWRADHHHGVNISAIIFGGRRAHLTPLVYEAFSWTHGVYIGATMASERTAAQFGKQGEVRRDPMAMLPFCGYNMADYFEHWLRMGVRMVKQPKIFNVNWFRQDENGKFLWPGYGENIRILDWILARCSDEVDATKTAIGWIPKIKDLNLEGLNLPSETVDKLFEVNKQEWIKEAQDVAEYFEIFGQRLPMEMRAQHDGLKRRLDVIG